MKKFTFSLDKVLNYKAQIEKNLQNEHARCVQETAKKEREIEALEEEHARFCSEYEQIKQMGASVNRLCIFEEYLQSLADKIRGEKLSLIYLRRTEEAKRQEVVAARKETASIDILREKRSREYDKALQKEEEKLVEEFVSNHMSGKTAAG